MGRPPCCDKSNVKRGLWTAEEDAKILAYVSNHGVGNWTLVPKKAGLNRCGKSCRLRWTNYLRPDLKHDSFTQQEEELIIGLHKAIGSRWSLIAKQLPGRTDNDVKNYWNTKLKKKLIKMQIDPVTHKPFPQVLSDYGHISGLSTSNHTGIINKSVGNKVTAKTTSSVGHARFSNASINNCVRLKQYQNSSTDAITPLQYPSQFHVINNEIVRSHFLNEATSSCSSSSSNLKQLSSPQSYSFPVPQEQVNCSFNWSEFHMNDPLLSVESLHQEMQGLQGVLSSYNPSAQMQNEVCLPRICNGDIYNMHEAPNMASGTTWNCTPCGGLNSMQFEGPLSSVDSFVDAILNRDSEMTAAFPELFDGSFDI